MSTLTFIASVVDSLAWPALVLSAILILRKPVRELVPFLRRAKYKEFDVFGEKLEEIDRKADDAQLPVAAEPPPWAFETPDDWTFGDYIERLAPVSPRVAISEAWRNVELAIQEAGRRLLNVPASLNVLRTAKDLQAAGRLPRDAASLLADLRGLRNRAVHASDFDLEAEQAIEFGRLAERLLASIRVEALPPEDRAR